MDRAGPQLSSARSGRIDIETLVLLAVATYGTEPKAAVVQTIARELVLQLTVVARIASAGG